MKIAAGIAACAGAAVAFSNTAPLYSSSKLGVSGYILGSSAIAQELLAYSKSVCEQDEKLVIYRVAGLEKSGSKANSGLYIDHVRYSSGASIDLPVDESCAVEYVSWGEEKLARGGRVVIVDVEDGQSHSVDEFLGSGHVIVQGKPSFKVKAESLKDWVESAVSGLLSRRASSAEDEEVGEYSEQDVEADFRAAESLVAEEEGTVTAVSEAAEAGDADKVAVPKNSNLFTKYQFFTPGLWSALIVVFFLVYVTVTAVSWISSIQTSYGAFEKQIDFEKKEQ